MDDKSKIVNRIRASPHLVLMEDIGEGVSRAVLDIPEKGIAIVTVFPCMVTVHNAKARICRNMRWSESEMISKHLMPLLNGEK